MTAFPGLLYNPPGMTRGGPPQDDEFGLIASRVAEQIGSTRTTSQAAQTKAATEVATRPQPTRAVQITENPDGTITRTETVKNAPKKDPQQEIASAANEPYAQFAMGVLEDAAALGQEQNRRFDQLRDDPRWQTIEGRRELAKEQGIVDPAAEPGGFMRRGFFRYRADRSKYEDLIADPNRLRSSVLAREFQQRTDLGDKARPFANDIAAGETRARLSAAEQRQQEKADAAERKNAIIDLTRLDTSSFDSPDKVVEWMKQGYGAEEWETVKTYLEPAARMKYAQDSQKREKAAIELTIKENDAKIRELREKRMDDKSDATLEHLILSNERLRQLIEKGDKPVVRKTFEGWTADDMVEAVGREDVDQDALKRKANSRMSKLSDDINANNGKIRVLRAEIQSMEKNEAWKVTDIVTKKTRYQTLIDDNARLGAEVSRLKQAGFGGRPAGAANRQPTTGNRRSGASRGHVLSPAEAAAALEQP